MKKWHIVLLIIVLIWLLSFTISQITKESKNIISKDRIAIIPIEGVISTISQNFPTPTKSSQTILENLKSANEDSGIKAIILEINSPGGTVIASKEIADYIGLINKPVISVIREVGASGAYWIAASSDSIIADPLSITGSIGVTSSYIEINGVLEKFDAKYQELTAGENKELGNPLKELTDEERAILEKKLEIIHEFFLEKIQETRTITDLKRVETGEFFLGVEAKELGLIDKFGNLDTAVEEAKQQANIKDAELFRYEERRGLFNIFGSASTELGYAIGRGIGAEVVNQEKNSVNIRL